MKEEILENIKKPYFKNMEKLGLIESKKELVLNKIFNQPVRIKGNDIYDINDNIIYHERSNGYWGKTKYDNKGNKIYKEYGNLIYFNNSDGKKLDRRK